MRYVIDRFEGNLAVCEREDRTMETLPRSVLPDGCREGSALERTEDGLVLLDNEADRARIRRKMERLFGKTE